eukprot:CAMPEP_0118830432 /NCGR_PEP_ID=MMETSP1162-20130426/27253_1 /TAXON_ID=33656 /ORGANISM="Phaeocystis Sp, Strain CCMP2710" /LENGTH=90 /DNA_ID=CAMNT_0006761757 /DNA_START=191 /DNA_END=460 /DNA_ORIENTATION=-
MAASSASIVLLLFDRCAPRCLARPAAGRFAGTTCDELGAISGLCFATGLATGLAVGLALGLGPSRVAFLPAARAHSLPAARAPPGGPWRR